VEHRDVRHEIKRLEDDVGRSIIVGRFEVTALAHPCARGISDSIHVISDIPRRIGTMKATFTPGRGGVNTIQKVNIEIYQ
jgi:hypothetical protein